MVSASPARGWAHAALGAAVLAAAMGIGRFAYTPILPLMTAPAGLTAQAGATLATETTSATSQAHSPVRFRPGWRAPTS